MGIRTFIEIIIPVFQRKTCNCNRTIKARIAFTKIKNFFSNFKIFEYLGRVLEQKTKGLKESRLELGTVGH